MPQRKEQEKLPEKELNEMEATKHQKQSLKQCIKRLKDLIGRMDDLSENLN